MSEPVEQVPIEEPKQKKPKRKCSQKQLAALAAGRAKNKHFKPKTEKKNVEQDWVFIPNVRMC